MKKIVIVLSLIMFGIVSANDGSLDPSFGTNGIVTTDIGGAIDRALHGFVQPDNKIVSVGFTDGGGTNDFVVVRYTEDGSLDTSFGTNGIVITNLGGNDQARWAILQLDGKIIAIGFSGGDFALVRYKADGTLDTSFGTNGIVTTTIGVAHTGALQSDGKIVAAGSAATDFALVRYKADGTLDTSFGTNGIVTTDVGGSDSGIDVIVLQPDGKIVAAGSDTIGGRDFILARYKSDGSLDQSFGTSGIVITTFTANAAIFSIALQLDGKIIAAGYAGSPGSQDFVLVRYNPDGSLDNTFGTNGVVTTDLGGSNDQINQVLLETDGKIIAFGGSNTSGVSFDFVLARYLSDGTLDTSFGTNGFVLTNLGQAGSSNSGSFAEIQADGKIITLGYSTTGVSDFALARYLMPSISISALARDLRAKYTLLQNLYL